MSVISSVAVHFFRDSSTFADAAVFCDAAAANSFVRASLLAIRSRRFCKHKLLEIKPTKAFLLEWMQLADISTAALNNPSLLQLLYRRITFQKWGLFELKQFSQTPHA